MKETQEKIPEAEDPFGEYKKERAEKSEYFKPEFGIRYDIVLQSFEFKRVSFGQGEPPAWRIIAKLLSLNGALVNKEWTTSSKTIIDALEPYFKRQEELPRIIWMVKKNKKGQYGEYIFEDIGRVGANASPSKGEKAESFL